MGRSVTSAPPSPGHPHRGPISVGRSSPCAQDVRKSKTRHRRKRAPRALQRSACCSVGTPSCQGAKPGVDLLRAGAIGGPVVGRPRCPRIAWTTVRSVMKASSLRRPPQGQASTSSRKTRWSNSAHGILASGRRGFEGAASGAVSAGSAGAAGAGADPRCSCGLSTGAAGTISARQFEGKFAAAAARRSGRWMIATSAAIACRRACCGSRPTRNRGCGRFWPCARRRWASCRRATSASRDVQLTQGRGVFTST